MRYAPTVLCCVLHWTPPSIMCRFVRALFLTYFAAVLTCVPAAACVSLLQHPCLPPMIPLHTCAASSPWTHRKVRPGHQARSRGTHDLQSSVTLLHWSVHIRLHITVTLPALPHVMPCCAALCHAAMRLWQEQMLKSRQLVLAQQAKSAVQQANKAQRELYIGNLAAGQVTEGMLQQVFNSALIAAFPDAGRPGCEPVIKVRCLTCSQPAAGGGGTHCCVP